MRDDDDDDTDAGDIRRRGAATSVNGPVTDAPGLTDAAQPGEDVAESLPRYKDVPVDFTEVQSRLESGQYTTIVCNLRCWWWWW